MCYFRLEKKKKTVLRPIQYERDERKSHHHQKKIVTVILINSFFFPFQYLAWKRENI